MLQSDGGTDDYTYNDMNDDTVLLEVLERGLELGSCTTYLPLHAIEAAIPYRQMLWAHSMPNNYL
jgi:hypothetical protein